MSPLLILALLVVAVLPFAAVGLLAFQSLRKRRTSGAAHLATLALAILCSVLAVLCSAPTFAADRVVVRQPFFRPNTTIVRQAPQRAAIVVQPRQQFVVQQQPQAFFFQQPQAFVLRPQVQAFSFGPQVQQFSLPGGCNGGCASALLFGR